MKSISELHKNQCCGCGSCLTVCARKAISMTEDEYGFVYPKINSENCINCRLCVQVCGAYHHEPYSPLETYAAVNRNLEQLNKSSSGGIFSGVADAFLSDGGIVCGAAMHWQDNMPTIEHVLIDTVEDLYKLQGSKYVQSSTTEAYEKVVSVLKSGKRVLFSGTPCQVASMKALAGRWSDYLYTIDIICHGVPSQKMFQDYIAETTKPHFESIESYCFRDKRYGWGLDGNAEGFLLDGTQHSLRFNPESSSYYHYFLAGEIYRASCYQCPYAQHKRIGDLTIGDYWGAQNQSPELLEQNGGTMSTHRGISCMLVNTEKGKSFLDVYGSNIDKAAVEFSKLTFMNTQLIQPSSYTKVRNKLLKSYKINGYAGIEQKFQIGRRIIRYKRKLNSVIKTMLPPKMVDMIKEMRNKL